jgi:hypothetical protein
MSSLVDLKYNILQTAAVAPATLEAAFLAVPLPLQLFQQLGVQLTSDSIVAGPPIVRDVQLRLKPQTAPVVTATVDAAIGAVTALAIGTKGVSLVEPPVFQFVPQAGDPAPFRQAQATATLDVLDVNVIHGGSGYTGVVTAVAVDGFGAAGGVPAALSVTVVAGVVTVISVVSKGSGYVRMPSIVVSGTTGGSGCVAIPDMELNALNLIDGGLGYIHAPTVNLIAGFQYRFPVNTAAPFVNMLTNLFQSQLAAKVYAQPPAYTP